MFQAEYRRGPKGPLGTCPARLVNSTDCPRRLPELFVGHDAVLIVSFST
jgi:hypothetical protein